MKKDLRSENVKKIAEVFPMCITEIRDKDGNLKKVVDFEKLKDLFSDDIREKEEAYEFTWAGKRKALHKAFESNDKILRPVVDDSLNFFDTQNIYIEGDNLDVLKILRRSYFEKVKVIYIDPPYNTGHDFIYKDDFKKSKEEYDEEQEVYDEEGNMLRENKESDGRFHSNWCSMIYSRLLLARDLLRPDGVIFISIDDNEVASLRKICDEVFGEDNFVCQFIWKSKLGKVGTTSLVSSTHEYIICYSKFINHIKFKMIEKEKECRKENLRQWGGQADRREDRPSMFYPININGLDIYPIKEDGTEGRWRVGKDIAYNLLKQGLLEVNEKNGKFNIYRVFEKGISITPYESLLIDIGTTAKGAISLKELQLEKLFDYSKPVELISFFINLCSKPQPDDIILDFFSGSATTAHAVMQLNAEDNGNRKYIMVQIPEKCDEKSEAYKAGYKNICEIGKERIRRAGKKIKEETNANIDYGFKVFKVDSSNFKEEISVPADEFDFKNLENCIENIKEDRTPLDLVYQCILTSRKELTLPIKTENIDGFTVYNVDNFSIMCCFDENISDEVMKYMADKEPEAVYFRDSCFRDSSHKLNVKEYFKVMSETTRFEDV